jgi:hypothetical protein
MMTNTGSSLEAFLQLIELSLSYDNAPEAVQAILDNGLIPMGSGVEGSEEARVHKALMGALAVQGA